MIVWQKLVLFKVTTKRLENIKNLPLVPDVKSDLSSYVVEKGMDGIFHYLAVEEAKIRTNPVARTTDLLKKVFTK